MGMKDRIGNVLAAGDKVLVELPVSSIIGFVADLQEPGLVAVRPGTAGSRMGSLAGMPVNSTPGRVLVSCVVALPVDGEFGAVAQLVKVYDAAKEATQETLQLVEGKQGPSRSN
jgi:hypothetical protein